jgi:hypothetical protein
MMLLSAAPDLGHSDERRLTPMRWLVTLEVSYRVGSGVRDA